jgi:hypothetical protein
MRGISLVAGAALVVLAFAAVTRVSDTREGLIAEVITLLGGLAGIGLLVYGLAARKSAAGGRSLTRQLDTRPAPRPRTTRDLVLGAGGIALALILLGGLALSGGVLWAGLGLALMLPMISGSVYLCVRFLRASSSP